MATDCGCSSAGCQCAVIGGDGISVNGIGTGGDPFVIRNTRPQLGVTDTPSLDLTAAGNVVSGKVRLAPLLRINDTDTVDLTLTGAGTEDSPFVLTGQISGVDIRTGVAGNVLTRGLDGVWRAGPAAQLPAAGAPMTDSKTLIGDGTGGAPLRFNPVATYADLESLA